NCVDLFGLAARWRAAHPSPRGKQRLGTRAAVWGPGTVVVGNGGREQTPPPRSAPGSVAPPSTGCARCWWTGRFPAGSRLVRNLDLAVDDLLFELVEFILDRLDGLFVGLGVVHTAVGEVEALDAGLWFTLDHGVDHFEDGDVHLLDGGSEGVGLLFLVGVLVLAAVDTDEGDVGGDGGLEDAVAGGARSVVDHVGTAVVLGLGGLTALGRVAEAVHVRRLAQVVDLDVDVVVQVLDPGDETGLELVDQWGFHTA